MILAWECQRYKAFKETNQIKMNKQARRRIFRRAEEMEESVMKYNFDEVIDRKGTHAMKVERLPKGAD